ncbi:hypothetical protein C0081_11310 [Cohaesibacter celericrescens]|uniref:Capsule synthesis protein CapA domain-containing protein n=2 Tax=Cohaesibacter celericrescens TaxID=2067669 RepID=A0A2N5XQ57_9HYPH|nr:hypothetical protein C0081_11310 [Cohaesibacter celericrescens]
MSISCHWDRNSFLVKHVLSAIFASSVGVSVSSASETIRPASIRLDMHAGKPHTYLAMTTKIDKSVDFSAKTEGSEHFTLVMVGDTGFAPSRAKPLPDKVYKYGRALTFEQTLKSIKSEINGDINFANIETVISASSKLKPVSKKYNFMTHPNGVRHLVDAGFNLFSMANNHAFDYGQDGVRDSVRHANALLSKGLLAHAGIGNNHKQAARTPVFQRDTLRVAFGAVGIGAGGGGIQRATDKRPGQLNLFSPKDRQLLANNLSQAPADLRLLSVHHGPERHIRPSGREVQMIRQFVRNADANVMIGHHAHVSRGIEIMNGRLIIYGLGNFNHQGTANMNGKNGCHNYSLLVRVHFTQKTGARPQIAAIEAVPINSTHMQPTRIKGRHGARRIAILNGLANQFDNKKSGSSGVRFMAQTDGSGLYCTKAAAEHLYTRQLCGNFRQEHLASKKKYQRAAATCGGSAPLSMIAKAIIAPDAKRVAKARFTPATVSSSSDQTAGSALASNAKQALDIAAIGQLPLVHTPEAFNSKAKRGTLISHKLDRNPDHWPAGIPLAWAVPTDENAKDRLRRWQLKRYSVAEVEKLLKKRGLIN